MATDSHFTIGSSHSICQDYALHGENELYEYGIISDGCSGSKNTDVGARLLALTAKNLIEQSDYNFKNLITISRFEEFLLNNEIWDSPLVDDEAYDATLGIFIFDKRKGVINIFFWGDGNIFVKFKDGKKDLLTISYESGAPFYLSYKAYGKTKSYEEVFGNKYAKVNFKSNHEVGTENRDQLDGMENLWHVIYVTEEIEFICISSDGADSLSGGDKMELFDFKSLHGDFVKRRFRGIAKYLKKNNLAHYDDLSMAAISFT